MDNPGELAGPAAGGHTAGSWPGRSRPGTGLSEPAKSPVTAQCPDRSDRYSPAGGWGRGRGGFRSLTAPGPGEWALLFFLLPGRGTGLEAVRGKVPDVCLIMPQLKTSPPTRRFPVCSRPSQPPLRAVPADCNPGGRALAEPEAREFLWRGIMRLPVRNPDPGARVWLRWCEWGWVRLCPIPSPTLSLLPVPARTRRAKAGKRRAGFYKGSTVQVLHLPRPGTSPALAPYRLIKLRTPRPVNEIKPLACTVYPGLAV